VSVAIEDLQATFAATLVDEWVAHGLAHAVVCPGSRSTPLALALAERDDVRLHVRLDERGACFFAIGLALGSGLPAVVCTTSGTAAAELHPGVVEASHARVPLLVCTADRPPWLHQVGAPQTIDQLGLFGSAPRRSFHPGLPQAGDRGWWRELGAATVRAAIEEAGPVHLNLAFDEPLVGRAGTLPPAPPRTAVGRRLPVARPTGHWGGRGVVVAGAGAPGPEAVLGAAERLGWPVLASPTSGLRVAHPAVVGAADLLLGDPVVRSALAPEQVLVLGRPWASRALTEAVESLGRSGVPVVAVGDVLDDPGRVVSRFVRADPVAFLAALGAAEPIDGTWSERWSAAEARAQEAIDRALAEDPLAAGGRATEPGVARHVFAALDPPVALFVSSSMPVRDLESFSAPRPRPPMVWANRGANGIDGVTSSALGAAAGRDGSVVCLQGDLAFLHDVSALAAVGAPGSGSCTLVVLDNGGGGIFSFLPQAQHLEAARFEQLFGTPPAVSVAAVGRGFSLPVAEVTTLAELDAALDELVGAEPCALVRVAVPDRRANRALHNRLRRSVVDAVRSGLGR
jgi:2-succinyl-5-enolpyruvyl-6-hydroxy-3-cyclohexene-1-carboxylate synthase